MASRYDRGGVARFALYEPVYQEDIMPSRQTRRTPAKVRRTPSGEAERTRQPRPSPQADGDSRALEAERPSSGQGKGATERRAWRRQRAQAEQGGESPGKRRH